jgi:hypothetical protein
MIDEQQEHRKKEGTSQPTYIILIYFSFAKAPVARSTINN